MTVQPCRGITENRSVLVTGGSGFIGSHLLFHLLDMGFRVRCFDRVKPPWLQSGIEFIEGDFTASQSLASALKGVDILIHLVSTTLPKTSHDDPQFDVISNLAGTIGLLNQAVQSRVKRLIFISSCAVYGRPAVNPVCESHPTNPLFSYGIVKLAIEKYLRMYYDLYGLESCVLRLSNLYGEHQRADTGQGAIAIFCDKALKGEPIEIWGSGAVVRDYLYVKDAVEAITRAVLSDESGTEINIGSGKGASLNEVIETIESLTGWKIERRHLPCRPFDVEEIRLDIAEAKRRLGWEPSTDLRKGIQKVIDWMKTGKKYMRFHS